MSFSGFSEDDIKRMSSNPERKPPENGVTNGKSFKKVVLKPKRSTNAGAKTNKTIGGIPPLSATQIEMIPESAKLRPLTATNDSSSTIPQADSAINDKTAENGPNNSNAHDNLPSDKADGGEEVVESAKNKYRDLDEFEAKQKLIEEQNRRRKELLVKALADRTRRTQEEAQRLDGIQVEFKKLDAMLSDDVKILRKQIEVASIDYSESLKKYQKIEREYLEVKLLMQQKLEKKEMLTEHLCTIIEKNEERKAEKLNELLKKLQLEPQLERNDDAQPTS